MGESPLSSEDVLKVARLARLAISADQVEQYRAHLGAVLEYMESLRQLDLSNVEPMSHPTDVVNRLDQDTPGEMLPTEAFLRMAPATDPPFLKVPKVLGDSSSA